MKVEEINNIEEVKYKIDKSFKTFLIDFGIMVILLFFALIFCFLAPITSLTLLVMSLLFSIIMVLDFIEFRYWCMKHSILILIKSKGGKKNGRTNNNK